MESLGIQNNIINWCKDFLSARRQRVVLNGTASDWRDVTSGVPQGSILGPTMFVIYINDMPEMVSSTLKLFADDAKVYRRIRGEVDVANLQGDLSSLEEWARTWQMTFNPSKCQVLHLGRGNARNSYTISEVTIEATDTVKDLGVIMTSTLSLEANTRAKVAKANQLLGIVRRSFHHLIYRRHACPSFQNHDQTASRVL